VPDVSVGAAETCLMEWGSILNPSKLSSFAAVFRTFNTSLTTALWLNFISKSMETLPHLKTKRSLCTVKNLNRNDNFLKLYRPELDYDKKLLRWLNDFRSNKRTAKSASFK